MYTKFNDELDLLDRATKLASYYKTRTVCVRVCDDKQIKLHELPQLTSVINVDLYILLSLVEKIILYS